MRSQQLIELPRQLITVVPDLFSIDRDRLPKHLARVFCPLTITLSCVTRWYRQVESARHVPKIPRLQATVDHGQPSSLPSDETVFSTMCRRGGPAERRTSVCASKSDSTQSRCKRDDHGGVGALRRVQLGPAAGDPSTPGGSYDCRCDGPACDTPKSRFRFDWESHGSAAQAMDKASRRSWQPDGIICPLPADGPRAAGFSDTRNCRCRMCAGTRNRDLLS